MSLEAWIFIGVWVIAVIIFALSRATKHEGGYDVDYYDDWDIIDIDDEDD